jgi:hypothetical protein
MKAALPEIHFFFNPQSEIRIPQSARFRARDFRVMILERRAFVMPLLHPDEL